MKMENCSGREFSGVLTRGGVSDLHPGITAPMEGTPTEYLEEVFGEIFGEQLGGWYRVPCFVPAPGAISTPSIAGSSGVFTRASSISATIRFSKRRSEPHGSSCGRGWRRFDFLTLREACNYPRGRELRA